MSTTSFKYFDEESRTGKSRYSQFGTSSNSRSFEIESWSYIKHGDYNLQVMQKVQSKSQRSKIPANYQERMAFYRAYTSSMYKTHINCMQEIDIRLFIWYYAFNMIFKALPSVYTQLFLSDYSTDEHLYISKMVPFNYGANWLIIVATFCELQLLMDYLLMYVNYIESGITSQAPWAQCNGEPKYLVRRGNLCIPTKTFRSYMQNATAFYNTSLLLMPDASISIMNEQNQVQEKIYVSDVWYYRKVLLDLINLEAFRDRSGVRNLILILILTCTLYGQIFKKGIFKTLNILQWALTVIFIWTIVHVTWSYTYQKPLRKRVHPFYEYVYKKLRVVDTDFLAESMVAPPLIHILRGRSHEATNPGINGGTILLSNILFYILKGLTTYALRTFCENHFGILFVHHVKNTNPWFLFWPVYLSTYPFGGFLTVVLFILIFVVDFLTYIIVFYGLLEVLYCEWPKIKKYVYLICLIVFSVICPFFMKHYAKQNAYLITKTFATLIDCVVLFWLYPVGRLADDITFHYGKTPSKFRIWSLKLTPLYYMIKCYVVHSAYYDAYKTGIMRFPERKDFLIFLGTWIAPLVLYAAGIIYAITKYLCIKKLNWQVLFRPLPLWGPREHIQRQLRKQFDSRVYIKSQSSRYLSRHHMSKEEDNFYKLDLIYDRAGRRSTVVHDTFKFDVEKKTA